MLTNATPVVLRFAVFFACTVLVVTGATSADDETVDYLRDIKPILEQKCFACHGALKQQASLRLDTVQLMLKGGDSGPVIVPGQPAESLLLGAMTGEAGFQMPPEEQGVPLKEDQLILVRRWIQAGAMAPPDEVAEQDPRGHWSFQSPSKPEVPAVERTGWPRNSLDAFVARQHELRGLEPQPAAAPHVLLRRLYLDLIGIPPTPDQLGQFLADPSDAAYELVVEDLLASPLYGQRWGRHWMDVWRYSDWYGRRPSNEIRYSMRHIWLWRDWIVDSLNADHGYDQMISEMLAGDELAPEDSDVLAATGFLGRNWYKFDRNTWLFETVERTGQSLLGMSFRCCRCHDHKFDPVSQLEYYQFRAFFEPHDVRTDPLSARPAMETDNGNAQVLTEGLSHVYDATLEAPTYLFVRGDDRNPDKSHVLSPAVPAALGVPLPEIQPVDLPVTAVYPALRPALLKERQALAAEAVAVARKKLDDARAEKQKAELGLKQFLEDNPGDVLAEPVVVLEDDFSSPNTDRWKIQSGDWEFKDGKLVQASVNNFATILADAKHPQDVEIIVRYRTLAPGRYRSVGFSYDYVDGGNSQDIYTSTGDATQSVQAFHRTAGKQVYPQAGIVKTPLKIGDLTEVKITARGQHLSLWLNGEMKLNYQLPIQRREGKFALWVHSGAAEFEYVQVKQLVPSRPDLEAKILQAARNIRQADLGIESAQLDEKLLAARIAAEHARYGNATDAELTMKKAAIAELLQAQAVVAVRAELIDARHALHVLEVDDQEEAAGREEALAAARMRIQQLEQKREETMKTLQPLDELQYEPLGTVYPGTSSGRRTALARWLCDPANPRTARVAVNHIWLRHFGEALVTSVSEFGLHGKPPSHPDLLDWLAVELIENQWRMKHLHRLMVLSSTYRMTSRSGDSAVNQEKDPGNRYLWRMNYRRMEAEVIRDSILSTAGNLDTTAGGPDLDQKLGDSIPRRSMYFRVTPDDRMTFLELFDLADPNACFRRSESVIPQQALAISNSALGLDQARKLARRLARDKQLQSPEAFIKAGFQSILSRCPEPKEMELCLEFLSHQSLVFMVPQADSFDGDGEATTAPSEDPGLRARENLLHVLYNHTDFITIR